MDAALPQRIDFAQLTLNLGNNRAVLDELLALFLTSASESISKMGDAERSRNVISWLQQAHHLRGAAQNITAKRLAGLCSEAEAINALPHPQSGAVLYHLQKELALVRAAIANFSSAVPQ